MSKYLIIEQGEYSDYSLFFVEFDSRLSEKEHLALINTDDYDRATLAGVIEGEITNEGHLRIEKIKDLAECRINKMFCCYSNRPHKSVLDREYSKEELLKIVLENDKSGEEYWVRAVEKRHPEYVKVLPIYQKLTLP